MNSDLVYQVLLTAPLSFSKSLLPLAPKTGGKGVLVRSSPFAWAVCSLEFLPFEYFRALP